MQKTMGGGGGDGETKATVVTLKCGGNSLAPDNVSGMKLSQLRRRFAEVLNITAQHTTVVVNGKLVDENEYTLRGGEEVEFIKPAGQKG